MEKRLEVNELVRGGEGAAWNVADDNDEDDDAIAKLRLQICDLNPRRSNGVLRRVALAEWDPSADGVMLGVDENI